MCIASVNAGALCPAQGAIADLARYSPLQSQHAEIEQRMSPKLTQDIDGAEFVENFLIATVVAILATRWYLELTGYPQLGGGGLHIAHMLWGGLLLVIALLMNLLLLDRRVLNSSAVIGGVGFGLFIDELGKFITADNDYFYQPTIALIYLILILLYLGLRTVIKYSEISPEEYLANALHLVSDGVIHGLLPQTRDRIQEYLANANQGEIEPLLRMMGVNSVEPSQEATRETLLARMRIKRRTGSLATFISGHKWFWPVVMGYMALAALATLLFLAVIIAAWLGYVEALGIEDKESLLDVSSLGLTASSLIAGLMAFAGLLSYPFSHRRALRFFHYSLLVSIFLVQFFQFEIYQLGAVANLVFNVIALKSIDLRVDNAAALDEAPNA